MRYSFTTANPKSVISRLTKIWIFYTLLSITIIHMFGIHLKIQREAILESMQQYQKDIETQDEDITQIKKDIVRLEHEINLDHTNTKYNNEIKDALDNLFKLIPDQITVTQMVIDKKHLILKGTTPTREMYSFLLQVPLKSVFTTSKVDFFPLNNGWYNFTSISEFKEGNNGF